LTTDKAAATPATNAVLAEAKSDITNTAKNAWANVHAARSNMLFTSSSPC
jgi:hypothetical protein